MALICPHCAAEMKEVKASATTGYLLVLDQCPRCGGIWTDRWEVFPLSAAAVAGIDQVDEAALHAPVGAAPAILECPRCRARMSEFHDPVLPTDARIERCPNCEGMWFNRGELHRFKRRAAPHTPRINDVELDRLVHRVRDPDTLPTVSNLDAAMQQSDESQGDVRGELAAGAAWFVVRAALRLLFRI